MADVKKIVNFHEALTHKRLAAVCEPTPGCRDMAPSYWIGADDRDIYHGMGWLGVDDQRWVMVNTAARSQLFPLPLSELLVEILSFEVLHALKGVLVGGAEAIDLVTLNAAIQDYQQRFSCMGSGGVGRKDVLAFRQLE